MYKYHGVLPIDWVEFYEYWDRKDGVVEKLGKTSVFHVCHFTKHWFLSIFEGMKECLRNKSDFTISMVENRGGNCKSTIKMHSAEE